MDYKKMYEHLIAKNAIEYPVLEDGYTKPSNKLLSSLQDLGNEVFAKQEASEWANSLFQNINKLKPDFVGKVGEKYVEELCKMLDIGCESVTDVNSKDGTYDNIIFGKRIEIKTARYGAQRAFQHESLRNHGCDFYMFIDIMPSFVYLTILPKFDLSQKSSVMERTPHLRKGASDVYKFDFSQNNIVTSIKKGYSLKIGDDTHSDQVKSFFEKHLSSL